MGRDDEAQRQHRGYRLGDLHAPAHLGSVGPCGRVQRPADRQPRLEEALPCGRADRRLHRQAGRKDRQGGREGSQEVRRFVRRGQVSGDQSPRGRAQGQARRGARADGEGPQRQRPRRAAADHRRQRHRLPDLGHAQLDRSAPVQPDVRDEDRLGQRRSQHDLPAPRNGSGHFRQLPERTEDRPDEDSVRHRADRQSVPQRDRRAAVHLPHARVRADGDAVLRPSGRRAALVRPLAARPA